MFCHHTENSASFLPVTTPPRPSRHNNPLLRRQKRPCRNLRLQHRLFFTDDTKGRRRSKAVNGVTTNFVYDGNNIIAEKDSSGTLTAKYFYDGTGKLLSMKKNGHSYYLHLNQRGDVVKITNESKTIVASYSYDPWGNITESTGTFANEQPFRYAGYYRDSETGLYYLMARYYDAGIGRFISRDPFAGYEDEPVTQMSYLYAGNSPVKYTDPTGDDRVVLSVPERKQGETNWCWAASTQMVIWYKTTQRPMQADIVRFIYGDQGNRPGDVLQVRRALGRWGLRSRGAQSAMSYGGIRKQIGTLSRPIIAGWLRPNRVGHMVVIKGYDYVAKQYYHIIYNNPWDGLGHKETDAVFRSDSNRHAGGGTGPWVASIYDIHQL